MAAFACKVDTSRETGSLVVCTCGFALGPFYEKATAVRIAGEHRAAHQPPKTVTEEQRVERNRRAIELRAAKKTLRNR